MPRNPLADLQAFVTVARERSFSRAAAQLGVSRSAISHAMSGLEQRLGVRLLTRTTRSVSPTQAGARLLASLEPRFAEIDAELAALGDFRDSPAGLVRISATDFDIHAVLWPRLAPLIKRHPELQIELRADYALTDIVADGFDAGVRAGDQIAKDMIAVLLHPDIALALVCAPDYLARRGRPRTPEELTRHACINLRLPTYGGLMPWELANAERSVTVRVEGPAIFNNTFLMLQAALDGLGIAYVPWLLAQQHVEAGRLVALLPEWWLRFPSYLYYPSRRHPSGAFAAVVDALRWRSPTTGAG